MDRKLRWYEHLSVNSYVLGLSLASGIITPLLLPMLVVMFMGAEYKNTFLGTVRFVGLAVAMFIQPVAGMLSDRSRSRFGRRRPFILISAVLNVLFLVVIGITPSYRYSFLNDAFLNSFGITVSYAILLLGIVLLQFSSNIGQGAVQGLMPDVVPLEQRGVSSGVKSVFELLPSLLIFLLGIGKLVDRGDTWGLIAILMGGFLLTGLAAMFVKERPQTEAQTGSLREPALRALALTVLFSVTTLLAIQLVGRSGTAVTGLALSIPVQTAIIGLVGLVAMAGAIFIGVYAGAWVGIGSEARERKPFIWWVINRLLFLAAVGSIQAFAQYFLADVLQLPNAGYMTTMLLAVVAVFLIFSALGGGALANRFGLRRLVFLSGLVGAAGTVLLIFARNVPMVIAAGCVIGIATGTFMATNWALGTQLVPQKDAGRYLGISNLAGAGAGIVGAGIGGPLADFFNHIRPGLGYLVIFAIYAGLFLLSSLTLGRIKTGDVRAAVD
jgi:MFS family permease